MSEDLNVYYDILSSKWWYFDGLSGQWIEYEGSDDSTEKFRRSDARGDQIRANTYDRGSRMDSFERVYRLSSYESGGRIRSFEKMKNLEDINRKKYAENDERIVVERRKGNDVARELARSSTAYVKMNDNKYIYKKTNRVREYEEPPPPRRIPNHFVREERTPVRRSIGFDLPKRSIEDYPQEKMTKSSYERNLYREPRKTLRRRSPDDSSLSPRQYNYYYENEKRLDDVERYEPEEDDLEYQPNYRREYIKREYEKAEYEKDPYEYEYAVDESYRQRYSEIPYRYNERYQNEKTYNRSSELVNEYDDRVYRKKELRVYKEREPSMEKRTARSSSHVYESASKSAPKYDRGGRYIPDTYETKSILKHGNVRNLSDSNDNYSPRNENHYKYRYDERFNPTNKNRNVEPKPKEIGNSYEEPDYPYSNIHNEPTENINQAEAYNANMYYDNIYLPKENIEPNIEQGLESSGQRIPEQIDEQSMVENEYTDDYANQFQNDYENEYTQECENEFPTDYVNEYTTPPPVYDKPPEKPYDNIYYQNNEQQEENSVSNTTPNGVIFKIKEQKIDTPSLNKTTHNNDPLESPSKSNMKNKKELSIEVQSPSCGGSELSERINNLIQEPKKQISYQGSSSELLGKLISESMSVSRLPSLSNQSVNTSDISKGIGDNFFNKKIGRSDTNRMSVTFSEANPKSIEIEKESKGRSNLKTLNLGHNTNEIHEDNTSDENDDYDNNSKEHDTDSSIKDKEKYEKDLDDFSNAPLVRRATRSLTFKDQGGLSGCLKVYLEKKNELMASSSNEGTNSIMEIKMANLKRRARELARRYRIKKGIIDEDKTKEDDEQYPGMTKFEKLMLQVQKQKKLEMENKEQTTS